MNPVRAGQRDVALQLAKAGSCGISDAWINDKDRKNMLRQTNKVSRTATALIALALLLGTVFDGALKSFASQSQVFSASACHCCNFDPAKCVTPVCCTEPVREPGQSSPASAPLSRNQSEWQAVSAAMSALPALPSIPNASLSLSAASTPPLRAIPIFQRDCSYLI